MIKNKMVLTTVFLVTVAFVFGIFVVSIGTSFAETAGKNTVINSKCPVLGNEVDKDTPDRVEYKGKTIGFCCSDCITKFNADPEKYMKNINDQEDIDKTGKGSEDHTHSSGHGC